MRKETIVRSRDRMNGKPNSSNVRFLHGGAVGFFPGAEPAAT